MKIVVLAGGISTERDVSLATGRMIYRAVQKKGHKAILLDVFLGYEGDDVENVFDQEKDWAAQITGVGEASPDIEQIKALRPDWKKNFFGPHVLDLCRQADLVFMALHGETGEDGKIQACFDLMGITYTGTDHVSSAICMNKGITKDILEKYGIPVPEGIRLKKSGKAARVPFPCIVKTACGGSSVGVAIARDEEEYEQALAEGFKYGDEIIVERYIEGREFSVGVLDGRALPVIEIAPLSGFYDYKNKYQAGSTIDTCPADLPAALPEPGKEGIDLLQGVVHALARADIRPHLQVFLHRHLQKDAATFGHMGQTVGHQLMGHHGGDVLALEGDGARLGAQQTGDGLQGGGLARAVGADQGDDLPFGHLKGHALDGVDGAVVDVDVIHLQHSSHRVTPPSSCPGRPR